jgi:hypothetical protein
LTDVSGGRKDLGGLKGGLLNDGVVPQGNYPGGIWLFRLLKPFVDKNEIFDIIEVIKMIKMIEIVDVIESAVAFATIN